VLTAAVTSAIAAWKYCPYQTFAVVSESLYQRNSATLELRTNAIFTDVSRLKYRHVDSLWRKLLLLLLLLFLSLLLVR